MATDTPRLTLSKPASGDAVSSFQTTVGTSFDNIDTNTLLAKGTWSGATAYAVNDLVLFDGLVYRCTTAHTNHTPPNATYWEAWGGSGLELGYAQITSNVTTAVTSTATQVDATGLIITVTVGTRPIMLEFWALVWNATIDRAVICTLVEAAAGDTNRTPVVGQGQMQSSGASGVNALDVRARLAPSAGSHTYKVQFCGNTGAGTSTIGAAAAFPAFIRAAEC